MRRELIVRYFYGTFRLLHGSGKSITDYLDMSAMKSRNMAVAAGWAKMAELQGEKQAITISVEGRELDGGDWPGEGFDIGDAVDSMGINSTGPSDLDTWRCVGINTTTDKNGNAVPVPLLNSQAEEYAVRTNRWLNALNSGTLGGRTSAAPTNESLSGVPTGPIRVPDLPSFTLSGVVSESQSPLWEAKDDIVVTGFIMTIRQPGDEFLVSMYQNGSTHWPITVPAATSRFRGWVGLWEIEVGDLIGAVIPSAGASAEDLTIQFIGGPLIITDEAFGA